MSKEQTLLRAGVPSLSPGPGLKQEIKEEPEEQSVKQEEEQLPVCVPESSAVCVKREDSSRLQQRQKEEDISSEPHFHTEHFPDTDFDDDWEPPFRCPAAQTEDEEDHYNQAHGVNSEDVSGAEVKREECPFCQKMFGSKQHLQRHIRVHVGERPYSCSVCDKTFTQKNVLDSHMRTHTGERPFICPVCKKTFAQKGALDYHIRTHTGERPYSCSLCQKTFTQSSSLSSHRRIHTGEKPFSCAVCDKTFNHKSNLRTHMSLHIGDKPFLCSFCDKTFTQKAHLKSHMGTHRDRDAAAAQTLPQTGFILFIVNPAAAVNTGSAQGGIQ